jgi:hypothetical protein
MVRLNGRFMSDMIATVNPDGSLRIDCVTTDHQRTNPPSDAARPAAGRLSSPERFPSRRRSAATITVINNDGAGEGFNDTDRRERVGGNPGTTRGAQRLNAFTYAATLWGAQLTSAVTIKVDATMDSLTCSASGAVLGSAGANTVHANFTNAPYTNTYYPQALANQIAGSDLDSADSDIVAQFNSAIGTTCAFSKTWY